MSIVADRLDQLFAAIEAGTPIWIIMRADEQKSGNEIVRPGDVPWLSADDWDETIVVSKNDRHVRLVAILAKRPGNGALRRTIDGIIAAGLVPQIVEPTHEMRATCKRWGWRSRRIGHGFETQEIWYPRPLSTSTKAEGE